MLSHAKQPVLLMRKVRLKQLPNELLEDLARFIGISSDELLEIVLKTMTANDADFQSGRSRRRVQQERGAVPLRRPASAEIMEAA